MPESQIDAFGAMLDTVTSLPPAKRYITTHNAQGKSVVHSSPAHKFNGHPSVGGVARSYAVKSFPVELKDEEDVKNYTSKEGEASYTGRNIVNTNGLNLNSIELAPGGCSQFHRTLSIDFVIITNGHIRMQLDTGEFLDLYPGDHVVQRGTMHKWSNPSETEPARMVAVVVPAKEFEVAGKKVEEEHFKGSEEKDWDYKQLEKQEGKL